MTLTESEWTQNLRRVSTETVIRTKVCEGVGEEGSPFREVVYWHEMDGTLIAKHDPCSPSSVFPRSTQ